jgi:hypothetical protein
MRQILERGLCGDILFTLGMMHRFYFCRLLFAIDTTFF